MAESEGIDGSGNTVCGNEWEFVSLTASTYASARGPKATEQDVEDESDVSKELEDESPRALFMSRHFTFLVDESLQSEADKSQTQNTDNDCELVEEGYKAEKQFIKTSEMEARKNRLGANLTEKEVNLSDVAPNNLFHTNAPLGLDEKVECPNFTKFSEHVSDINMDVSEIYSKDHNSPGESNLPCEAWWKRQAAFLYAHAKETNTLWSVFIAAAVMGLVCLGHHLRTERSQILQLKWNVSVKEEQSGRVLRPIPVLKNVILASSRARPFTQGANYEL